MFIWVYCNSQYISISSYLFYCYLKRFKSWTIFFTSLLNSKIYKKNLDKTKPGWTTVILRNIFCQSLGFRTLYWGSTVVNFRGLRNLSWQSIWEIDVYSAVLQVDWSSWSLSPSSLNLNYLWMGEKKLFNTCPFRNYSGKLENENCSNIYLQGFPLALSWTNKSLIIVDMT